MDFETREIRRMELKDKKEKVKKKKSKVATFFIALLLLINIGLLGYIAYDKGLLEEVIKILDKKEEKKEKKVIENPLSLENEEVSTLYSYLTPLKEKFVMNSEVDVTSFTNEEKLAFALALLKEEDFEKQEEAYRLKSVFLEEAGEKILGENEKVENGDLKTAYYEKYSKDLEGNVTLTYEEIEDCYTASFQEKEEKTTEPFYTELVSAKKKGNQIILTEKVIYTLEEENIKIYSNWQLSKLLDEATEEALEETIDKYLEKGSEVSYTFEKKNGSYQFISSKIKEKN